MFFKPFLRIILPEAYGFEIAWSQIQTTDLVMKGNAPTGLHAGKKANRYPSQRNTTYMFISLPSSVYSGGENLREGEGGFDQILAKNLVLLSFNTVFPYNDLGGGEGGSHRR